MKRIRNVTILLITAFIIATDTADAQNQGRVDKMQSLIDSKNYIFKADVLFPLGQGSRQLSPGEYDLKVMNGTLISYLPYSGQAYSAVDPTNLGIKFTSNDFVYSVKNKKKDSWQILITPKDVRDIYQLILTVYINGSADLTVNSNNRQTVSFRGYVVEVQ